jgi:hypothetical protein
MALESPLRILHVFSGVSPSMSMFLGIRMEVFFLESESGNKWREVCVLPVCSLAKNNVDDDDDVFIGPIT